MTASATFSTQIFPLDSRTSINIMPSHNSASAMSPQGSHNYHPAVHLNLSQALDKGWKCHRRLLWTAYAAFLEGSYVPITHLYGAVLRGTGDDVVVMGTPLDVQHRGCVSTHRGSGLVNPATLWERSRCHVGQVTIHRQISHNLQGRSQYYLLTNRKALFNMKISGSGRLRVANILLQPIMSSTSAQ